MTDQPEMPEMPDLSGLLSQAQNMMAAGQAAAAEIVEGSAGGGVVRVRVNGNFEFESVSIDATVVDPNDVSMLEDLVLAALRDAATQISEAQSGALDLGSLNLGGLDLGGLLGEGDQ